MVRKEIKIQRIENASARRVTFSKRHAGLLKKARDLAVLCDAEVGVIAFSGQGKLFQFANPSMLKVLERYTKTFGDLEARDDINSSNNAATAGWRNLFHSNDGNLERLSLRELSLLEQQTHTYLLKIQSKKAELLLKQLQDIKEMVTEAGKTRNEKLMDPNQFKVSGLQNSGGKGGLEQSSLLEIPETHASISLQADVIELTSQGLLPAEERSFITEDLNELLAFARRKRERGGDRERVILPIVPGLGSL